MYHACNLLTQVDLQVVQIVDLSCSAAHPWQWLKLLDDFHGRPGGAPELYLTVLHDDNDFLADMQSLLSKKAESLVGINEWALAHSKINSLENHKSPPHGMTCMWSLVPPCLF